MTNTRVAPKATYLNPSAGFEPIAGAVAAIDGKVDRCTVNGEEVVPQPGGFYGGGCSTQRILHRAGLPTDMVRPVGTQWPSTAANYSRGQPTDRRGV